MFSGDQDLDASGCAGPSLNESVPFEREDHLVDGRRGDREVALQIRFGRWAPLDPGIRVDEGEVLALLLRELKILTLN